jgi:hypothetical protein
MKLANMEARLAALRSRGDLTSIHKQEVERSYLDMLRQYRRDIKLYEATHPELCSSKEAADQSPQS